MYLCIMNIHNSSFGRGESMSADKLIVAKKELRRLQKTLGRELTKGKYKDTVVIKELKREIRMKKLQIGDITKEMITQLAID